MVEKNQVEEILFKDSTIYVTPVEGYVYTEEVTTGGKTEEKSYKQTEDTKLTLYTAYLSNSELLPLLKEHKVAYTGYYEAEMNPILLLMINYILPVIIMVGLFMLLMRLMSKSGGGGFGGLGSVGKSMQRFIWKNPPASPSRTSPDRTKPRNPWKKSSIFCTIRGAILPSARSCPRARCWWARPARAKRCWPRPWPARRACRSSPFPARASWRCSWAWAPAVSAICSRRRPRSPRASSLSMRSTPSARPATVASAAATTSGSRR